MATVIDVSDETGAASVDAAPLDERPALLVEDDGAVEQEVATDVAPLSAMLPSPYREALTLTELEGADPENLQPRCSASPCRA